MKFIRTFLISLTLGLFSAGANAMIVEFDLTGGGGNLGTSETFSQSGVDLNLFAWAFRISNSTQTARNLRQNGNGLGVQPGPNGINNDDGTDDWLSEMITMSTSTGTVVEIGLRLFNSGEQANLGTSDVVDTSSDTFDFGVIDGASNALTWFAVNNTHPFAFVGSGDSLNPSNFRLAGVRVNAPVPSPAALLMLFGALGVLGLRRRVRA